MEPRYQVFVVNYNGWFFETSNLRSAQSEARRWAKDKGAMAYVVDTQSGAVIYKAEEN